MSSISHEIPSNDPPADQLDSQPIQKPQLVCTLTAHAPQSGSSQSPFPRSNHTLTVTANAAGELFLFGGYTHIINGDLYVLSTRDFSTTLLQTSGEVPAPRYAHGTALIGTTLLICGGVTTGSRAPSHDSLDLLNLGTREWSHVIVNGPGPSCRFNHTTNLVGSRLFTFGGWSSGKATNDMWTLDLHSLKSQPVWEPYEPIPVNERPYPRGGHVSVTTGDHIIMFVPSRSLSTLVIIFCGFGGAGNQYCFNV